MCIFSSPKPPPQEKPKDPAIVRNQYLDGVDPVTRALRSGRSSLRIERRAPGAGAPVTSTVDTGLATTPAPAPTGITKGSVGLAIKGAISTLTSPTATAADMKNAVPNMYKSLFPGLIKR